VRNLNNPETKKELSTNTGSTAIEEIQQRNSRSSSVIMYTGIIYLANNSKS